MAANIKMPNKIISVIIFLLLVLTLSARAVPPNAEKGDALLRTGAYGFGHAGIYIGYFEETAHQGMDLFMEHSGVDSNTWDERNGVDFIIFDSRIAEPYSFMNSTDDYLNAWHMPGMTPAQREIVRIEALGQIGSGFISNILELWSGSYDDPTAFRCDGLVEWCYEQAGFDIDPSNSIFTGPISRFQNSDLNVTIPQPPASVAAEITSGVEGENGWYTSDVGMTVTVTDADSQPEYIIGTIDDGTAVTDVSGQSAYAFSFTKTTSHTLTGYDFAGNYNTSVDLSGTISIDKLAPDAPAVSAWDNSLKQIPLVSGQVYANDHLYLEAAADDNPAGTTGWDNSGVTSYQYYWGTDPGGLPVTNADEIALEFSSLYEGSYYFRVKARDAAGHFSGISTFNYIYEQANQVPQLSNGLVIPASGDTTTDFSWNVDYYDPDGDSPSMKNVYIDGLPYAMTLLSGTAANGTYNYGPVLLDEDSHNFYFNFSDGNSGEARLPATGTYSGPAVSEPNIPPELSGGLVSPVTGYTTTTFQWTVHYSDIDGGAPSTADVFVDGLPFSMSLAAGDPADGSYIYSSATLAVVPHEYYFHFTDGSGGEARLPSGNGVYSGPQVLTEVTDTGLSLRGIPLDESVFLQWPPTDNLVPPVTYKIYTALTPGGQNFSSPDYQTENTSILIESLVNDLPFYNIVKCEDSIGEITLISNELVIVPGTNMIAGEVYNHDFEEVVPVRGPGEMIPGPPVGWLSSSQDFGGKTTVFSVDDSDPYEGSFCALIETSGAPGSEDLSIASLANDHGIPLLKDHTYVISAALRRSHGQWTRFILYSAGFSIIHTESIDALDDRTGDTGWEKVWFHFRAPVNLEAAFIRLDSLVTNERTAGDQVCRMWVDDIQVLDLGIETFADIYNDTPPPPQYGTRNRYFDLGTEMETVTLGGTAFTCLEMPRRWNIAMAVDTGLNNAAGYPVWGQEIPPGLDNTSGEAGFITARAEDTTKPAWPALAADGVRFNGFLNDGHRHALSFDYGAAGDTLPLLRVFMINGDFSHYSSLFIDPDIAIPGNRMWPLHLLFSPNFGDQNIKVRFDNVTLGPSGSGPHTSQTTAYIDSAIIGTVDK